MVILPPHLPVERHREVGDTSRQVADQLAFGLGRFGTAWEVRRHALDRAGPPSVPHVAQCPYPGLAAWGHASRVDPSPHRRTQANGRDAIIVGVHGGFSLGGPSPKNGRATNLASPATGVSAVPVEAASAEHMHVAELMVAKTFVELQSTAVEFQRCTYKMHSWSAEGPARIEVAGRALSAVDGRRRLGRALKVVTRGTLDSERRISSALSAFHAHGTSLTWRCFSFGTT